MSLTAVKDHDEYYADLIWEACDGAGTDEDVLTRAIVARRHRLVDINNKWVWKNSMPATSGSSFMDSNRVHQVTKESDASTSRGRRVQMSILLTM